jgi:1-deoxy-D-xylulose-5-phosphate reductoisomerase
MRRKKIIILGSTGSIGENAVKVASHLKDNVSVVGLAAFSGYKKIAQQAEILGCKNLALANNSSADSLERCAPQGSKIFREADGILDMIRKSDAELVLCGIVGTAGLFPVIESLKLGKNVALASKEVLVLAGEHTMRTARENAASIIPVDSEHSAIFQCMEGRDKNTLSRIILTASGGPFRDADNSVIERAAADSALLHPTWKMGKKVTIDSATLMNKALEIIEAKWLFGLDEKHIDVVIHPQSVIHSMVELVDGAILAQMSEPDMKLAIQYSITYPKRLPGILKPFDFAKFATLDFRLPDRKKFPSLDFAEDAVRQGGTMPAVMNAANEIAVEKFIRGEIKIPGIWKTIEKAMSSHKTIKNPSLDEILSADRETKARIQSSISIPATI